MSKNDVIKIELTRHELRLLAIAAAKIKRSAFIHQEDYDQMRGLAFRLLKHTKE